jgi:hypothetical protein
MSGRDRGMLFVVGWCMRVAGLMTYIPAHFLNGKQLSQKVTIPAIVNTGKRGNNEGRKDSFLISAWGKYADIIAKSFTNGRAFDAWMTAHSFDKRLWKFVNTPNGGAIQPVVDAQGQQVVCPNFVGFTIQRMIMGEESQKFITGEIEAWMKGDQANGRGPNWHVQGHPEYEALRQRRAAKQAEQFNPQSSTFGYARVHLPNGAQVDMSAYTQNQQGVYVPNGATVTNVNPQPGQHVEDVAGAYPQGQMTQYAVGQQPPNNLPGQVQVATDGMAPANAAVVTPATAPQPVQPQYQQGQTPAGNLVY